MAVLRLAFGFILLSTFTLTGIYSQNILHRDSIVVGKSYKFMLYDDSEIIGKVTSTDTQYIKVAVEGGTYRIRKEDIFLVTKNLTSNKFKAMLSLGGGTSILGFGAESKYEWSGKYAFQLSALLPFDESKGMRIETGYSRYERDLPDYDYYNSSSLNMFSLKVDFVFGKLLPEDRVWLIGSAGIGMNYLYEPGFEKTYYSYYDSTYHTSSRKAEGTISGVLSLGGSIGYWFNKRLGFYFDIQFNTLTYGGFFIFWGGMSYLPIRAGITYTLF